MPRDFTQGSVGKGLLALSIPIVGAQLLQSAYQFIDTFWVGRLGEAAVAAISLSFPVLFLMMSIAGGLSIGAGIIIAQYWGAKKHRDAEHAATQSAVYVILASIIVALIGWILTPWIMRLLGADATVFPLAVQYLQISFLGMPSLFGYFVYMQITRGIGEVKAPLYIVLSTVVLNLLLDPLFIYGWKWIPAFGVAGAAVASVATQSLSWIIGYYLLVKGTHGITLHKKDMRFDWPAQRRMLKIGLPASIDQSSRAFGLILMAGFVALLGTTIIAAYGIGLRVFSFIIIPAVGVMIATSTLVGQNVGAKQPDRAQHAAKLSMLSSFLVLTFIGILVFLFAHPIVAFFVPQEPQVIVAGAQFLRYMSLTFGLVGLQFAVAGAFRGSGHTVKALVITAITLFVVQIPLAYVLSQYTSLAELGIWIAIPIANFIGAIIALVWFSTESWKVPVAH